MEQYLSQCRSSLDRLDRYDSVCVVLGNEACDLDSAISALVLAQFLTFTDKYGVDTPHIPVLNINRNDFPLKTEVVYFLEKLGISSDHLIFRNDVNLASLKARNKLKLVLVDHNVLSLSDSDLDAAVVEIIDHHLLEHPSSDKIVMVVEPVGSCCTLISSVIVEQAPRFLKTDSATLLMGTIVLDVANFSVAAKRATAKDKRVFEQLSKIVPDVSKDDIYLQLQNAKANVSGLQFEQLLRKDVKVVQNDSFILAVSALPFLSSVFLAKYPDLQKKLYNFCLDYNYHGVVLVGIHIDQETDVVKRDILLFSSNTAVKNKLCQGLEDNEPSLKLTLSETHCELTHYCQGNVTATRKVILPLLKGILQKESKLGCGQPKPIKIPTIVEGSSGSSSTPNSGLYTPSNSFVDDGEAHADLSPSEVPEFDSGDVMAKLESTRLIPGRGHHDDDSHAASYPYTPKNSFVDNHFDVSYQKYVFNQRDTEAITEKLRQEHFFPEESDE